MKPIFLKNYYTQFLNLPNLLYVIVTYIFGWLNLNFNAADLIYWVRFFLGETQIQVI